MTSLHSAAPEEGKQREVQKSLILRTDDRMGMAQGRVRVALGNLSVFSDIGTGFLERYLIFHACQYARGICIMLLMHFNFCLTLNRSDSWNR